MLNLLRKDLACNGTVFFRGNIAPRMHEFESLREHGVQLEPLAAHADSEWRLKARHAKWGEATILCLRGQPAFPQATITYSNALSKAEREEARSAGPGVSVSMPAQRKNVLRDRKYLLRYLRAIMGDAGVIAADHSSERLWSRSALDEELSHDADLDIDSITCFHAVHSDTAETAATPDTDSEEPRPYWLHSHGLRELGAFDYDILMPSDDAMSISGSDALRAVSLAILEGTLRPDAASLALGHPGPIIGTVPAHIFQRDASPHHAKLRDHDEFHSKDRSVVCEPMMSGLLSRFRGRRPRPSRFFSSDFPEPMTINFSSAATELMAERAKATIGVFSQMHAEFARHEFPMLVKLGLPVGLGEDREHMWFEVHSIDSSSVDATLTNQPFQIASLNKGDRARHSLDLLTDWTIITPVGDINPRRQTVARMLREFPEVLAVFDAMFGGG